MTVPWFTHICVTLNKPLNLSEAQVPFLCDGDNNKQVVLFKIKGIMYVDHLAQCLVHRDCSIGFKGRLGQIRKKSWVLV